eukprot:3858031-Rhodomonas_salina.1
MDFLPESLWPRPGARSYPVGIPTNCAWIRVPRVPGYPSRPGDAINRVVKRFSCSAGGGLRQRVNVYHKSCLSVTLACAWTMESAPPGTPVARDLGTGTTRYIGSPVPGVPGSPGTCTRVCIWKSACIPGYPGTGTRYPGRFLPGYTCGREGTRVPGNYLSTVDPHTPPRVPGYPDTRVLEYGQRNEKWVRVALSWYAHTYLGTQVG